MNVEDNIFKLCFQSQGLLFNEFDSIFHDLFAKRSNLYRAIVEELAKGHSLTQTEICHAINRKNGRSISTYLNDLIAAGFISADHPWSMTSRKYSPRRKLRLSDNYLRFYLKYIQPYKADIIKGQITRSSLENLLNWDTIMGLQFENLIIRNMNVLEKMMGIDPWTIVKCGPYYQVKNQRQKGCQIDYMVQTKHGILYVCEIKFSKNPIGEEILNEVQSKIDNLAMPRHFSYKPVLIHVGGVTPSVHAADYFYRIIDATELMQ